jgi:thioredoxin reductase
MLHDVVIVGGGPAGLSAALILGRARKRVLLCDAGTPRNAAAQEMHGFVSRDGTPPPEFRRVAREQLAPYDSVGIRQVRATAVEGVRGGFEVQTDAEPVRARRVLLCVGVIDELPSTPGFRELWGEAIFQCPYCHGWEVRDRAFGYLVPSADQLEWALFLRAWSPDIVAFTNGAFAVPAGPAARLAAANVRIEPRPIRRMVARAAGAPGPRLEAVELEDGARVAREVLFARPRQRQTELVVRSGVRVDETGFVVITEQMETSRPGIYAAGDLTTTLQSAILAAAAGAKAAYAVNRELTMEGATTEA